MDTVRVLLAAPHHVNNATECSAQRPSHRAPCSLGPSVTDGSLYLGRERTEHCWDTKTSPSEGRREHRSVLEPRRSASTGRAAPRAQASRLHRVVRGTCPRRSPTAPQVLARLGAAPSDMRSYHCILVAPSCNQLTCMTRWWPRPCCSVAHAAVSHTITPGLENDVAVRVGL